MKVKESKQKRYSSHNVITAIIVAVVLIAGIVTAIIIGRSKGDVKTSLGDSDIETTRIGNKVYEPNKSVETYLFMGIDKMGKAVKDSDEPGQCDMLMLLVRDVSNNTFKTIPINRNTIADVDTLDTDGSVLATTPIQLALAHANGDGLESSCENTVRAVSRLLKGQKIDGYVAVNMGAIKDINHLAGGVTVKIEDDFSKTDKTLKKGESVHLTDEQAMHYVHDRMDVGDGLNESRMKRQNAYIDGLKPIFKEKINADKKFAENIYDTLDDYMVTNVKKSKFAKIAMLLATDADNGELELTGEKKFDELGWEEFIPDEENLNNTITQLFYREYK